MTEKPLKESATGLIKFRERAKFKQKELAEKLGLTPVAYNHYEKSKNEPDHSTYKKLFELGATVEELFGVNYSAKPPKADLKVSKEEATEIVRVGMAGLIGNVGLLQNGNVLGKGV
jgi:transcriptional regulator with XRE-family HTH domain